MEPQPQPRVHILQLLTDSLLSLFALLVDVLLALALLLLAQRLLVLLVEVLLLFAVLLVLGRSLVRLRGAVRPVFRLLRRVSVSLTLKQNWDPLFVCGTSRHDIAMGYNVQV